MASIKDERTKASEPREVGVTRILRKPGRPAWVISICLLVFFIILFTLLFSE